MRLDLPADEFVVLHPGSAPPEISLLMPIFQQEQYVDAAVRSVLAQVDVVAEVIISDDASGDETFERAGAAVSAALASGPVSHRVIMRRGRSNLRRDHVGLLADQASCDVVAQAHGDDLSHPGRARTLLDAFGTTGAALMASACNTIDASGCCLARVDTDRGPSAVRILSREEIVDGVDELIGCSQAWRRSAFHAFDRLDSMAAPVSHDRILPFRASLVGSVAVVLEPLLDRRFHEGNFSGRLFDNSSTDAFSFGSHLYRLNRLRCMRSDVARAREKGYLDDAGLRGVSALLDSRALCWETELYRAFGVLVRAGMQMFWVEKR